MKRRQDGWYWGVRIAIALAVIWVVVQLVHSNPDPCAKAKGVAYTQCQEDNRGSNNP